MSVRNFLYFWSRNNDEKENRNEKNCIDIDRYPFGI